MVSSGLCRVLFDSRCRKASAGLQVYVRPVIDMQNAIGVKVAEMDRK